MFNPLDPKFLVPWLIFEEDERAEAAERARRAAADRYDESGDESGDESDDELEEASNICPECGEYKAPHKVCPNCGMYRGRQVIAKDEESITFDMNHELAGKDLTFEIELLEAK